MQEKIEAFSEEDLKEKIRAYLEEYPTAGYGTHQGVITPPKVCDCHCHKDGSMHFFACCHPKWSTIMYRERSCD